MTATPKEFRYHPVMQLFAIVITVLPLAALYVPIAVIPDQASEARLAIFGVCGLLFAVGAPLLWEAMMWRIVVTDDGVQCRSPWRGSWSIAWSDIKRVEWSPVCQWFVVVPKSGRTFCFSYALGGCGRLLEEFERRLTPDQMRGALGGYAIVGRAWPYVASEPKRVVRSAGPRQPISGMDLSKWNGGRR